jgi:hypothetical protein
MHRDGMRAGLSGHRSGELHGVSAVRPDGAERRLQLVQPDGATQCTTDASVNLQQCFNFMTFQAGFNTFAPMFCSSGPPMDAGVEDSGVDSGSASDSGAQKDSGKPGEAGADSGVDEGFARRAGCHCDSSGASPAVPSALFGLFFVSVFRGLFGRNRRSK